ncbi:MAG TPA: HAD-IIIC family phosphatase [Humisphaera sp.]
MSPADGSPAPHAAAAKPDPAALRQRVDAAVADARWADARADLVELWAAAPSSATAGFVATRFARLKPHLPMTACRMAVLRSFTVEPVLPMAVAAAAVGGIDLTVRAGEFNAYAQEVLDPSSWLAEFAPTVVVLAVQTRDVSPALWDRFADLGPDEVDREVDAVAGQFERWVGLLRQRSAAHLVVHGLAAPAAAAQGLLDAQVAAGQADAIGRVNARLRAALRAAGAAHYLDYPALVARHGAARWEDERKWQTVRLPVAADNLVHLAREWARFLHPITGRVAKCLVTDLDNTLWGGVIGEDGMDGVRMAADAKGFPFRAVQRALLDLHRRGVLLAVASKNNEADAREALHRHPDMLLRPEHFAAVRINWADKATGLRQIAAELNIGVDALAFLDDNPVERAWVRRELPEVTVIDLPDDPAGYAAAVRAAPVFERLAVTGEDRARGRMYAEQRLRDELRTGAGSVEDYLRSLDMSAELTAITPATLARAAQLTQKTNQFNLTTRRYNEEELSALLATAGARGYAMRVVDRFGDNGIVAVAVTRDRPDRSCEIDTFLMSCRVIGRTVETALLSRVAADAAAAGCGRVVGRFLPTKKNAPAAGFLAAHGFARVAADADGTTWELRLDGPTPQCPPWVRLVAATPAADVRATP